MKEQANSSLTATLFVKNQVLSYTSDFTCSAQTCSHKELKVKKTVHGKQSVSAVDSGLSNKEDFHHLD